MNKQQSSLQAQLYLRQVTVPNRDMYFVCSLTRKIHDFCASTYFSKQVPTTHLSPTTHSLSFYFLINQFLACWKNRKIGENHSITTLPIDYIHLIFAALSYSRCFLARVRHCKAKIFQLPSFYDPDLHHIFPGQYNNGRYEVSVSTNAFNNCSIVAISRARSIGTAFGISHNKFIFASSTYAEAHFVHVVEILKTNVVFF